MNLKQAIARDPKHLRAHSNLGLVLAHNARPEEAVAEFLKSGCDEADARENVAFVLTTERHWDEARGQYRLALQARPASESAQSRLKQLDTLVAKVENPRRPVATRDHALLPASASGRGTPTPALPAAGGTAPAAGAASGRPSPSRPGVATAVRAASQPQPSSAPAPK
jgi:hypothetical protein